MRSNLLTRTATILTYGLAMWYAVAIPSHSAMAQGQNHAPSIMIGRVHIKGNTGFDADSLKNEAAAASN